MWASQLFYSNLFEASSSSPALAELSLIYQTEDDWGGKVVRVALKPAGRWQDIGLLQMPEAREDKETSSYDGKSSVTEIHGADFDIVYS